MDSPLDQAKALLKTEDGTAGAVIGKRIYDPYLFSPGFARFTAKQYLFLRAYRLGVPLPEAAQKAELTPEQAERFLEKAETRAWLDDRAQKDHIKQEWEEPGKWFQEGNACFEGRRTWTKTQLEVWKAFGERVAPVKRADSAAAPHIEIHINPAAVQEAFRRQDAIEASLVDERQAS